MNYIGSKLSLLDFIYSSILKIIGSNNNFTLCDIFAGTGSVGSFFKKKGYSIISNDTQYYSYILNKHYIYNKSELEFNNLLPILNLSYSSRLFDEKTDFAIDYLNKIEGIEGFIYKNYSHGGTALLKTPRLYFTDYNAKKCDAIRHQIQIWYEKEIINTNEYYYLLALLLENIDRVANTASVYGAFLKHYKKSATHNLVLKPIETIKGNAKYSVYNMDANKLIKNITCDILYLDPPYNHRQYASNYHILETIAKNDNPIIHGATGLRDYENQKSSYCIKKEAKKALQDLISNAKCKYIFMSYNNEGILSLNDIKEIFTQKGEYGCTTQHYTRFKSQDNDNIATTIEYLHHVICS